MNWTSLIVFWLGTAITIFIQLITYRKILNYYDNKINIKTIILIIIATVIVTYNAHVFDDTMRAFISYILMICLENIIFNDSIRKTISYGTFCYIISVFVEIVFAGVLVGSKLIDLQSIDNSIIGKFVFSILIVMPTFFIVGNKHIKKIANFVSNMLEKSIVWIIFVILFLAVTIVIAYDNVSNITVDNYWGNIFLLTIFITLIAIIIFKEYRVNKEVNNTKKLLDFMTRYERKIEEDRINRHEMLNNLLILKSYKDKNSEEYNNTLNELVDIYGSNDIKAKNIYKLPSGLKGIIYYKISEIKDKKIVININISKQLSNALEKINNNTYVTLCKAVGITFDNAIEASIKSKEKIINFDVYDEEENIVIEISNTFAGSLELNKINNKNYSTKGKGRGLGLYILKRLIRNNSGIDLKQSINGKVFITKLYIKKSR